MVLSLRQVAAGTVLGVLGASVGRRKRWGWCGGVCAGGLVF